MKEVELFTDGACSGNPGPGGWGAILRFGGREKELSGGEPQTTNNRMELTAAIEGLAALKERCRVTLCSDSRYLIDGIEKGVRTWFFVLAFTAIGLSTNFRELAPYFKGGKPLILYVCGQSFNLALTLLMAYVMFYLVFPEITAKI